MSSFSTVFVKIYYNENLTFRYIRIYYRRGDEHGDHNKGTDPKGSSGL